MSQAPNGSPKQAARAVTRNLSELFHDIVTLTELQARLAKTEAIGWSKQALWAGIWLVSGLAIALGCIPILLATLAAALVEFTVLSQTWSLLIASFVGLTLTGIAVAVGVIKLRSAKPLPHSQEEFKRNVNWIKQVLKHQAAPDSIYPRSEYDVAGSQNHPCP